MMAATTLVAEAIPGDLGVASTPRAHVTVVSLGGRRHLSLSAFRQLDLVDPWEIRGEPFGRISEAVTKEPHAVHVVGRSLFGCLVRSRIDDMYALEKRREILTRFPFSTPSSKLAALDAEIEEARQHTHLFDEWAALPMILLMP
jgi:hypothetical protein